jgi:hypothetical protein
MAERVVLVCDVCGSPAQKTVTFRISRRSLVQDLCATHLQELVRASHAPRRGRRPGATSLSAKTEGSSRRRRRGTESSASKMPATVKRRRRRITDPATLEKRRAALEKARKALASKRAQRLRRQAEQGPFRHRLSVPR